MKVKKFLKGFVAAALAVTMAVTPASSVKAAEVTVTSGPSGYTFSEEPVAAFVVSNWFYDHPITLFLVREGTFVYSQAGSSLWQADKLINDGPELGVETRIWRFPYDSTESYDYASDVSEQNQGNINIFHGMFGDGAYRNEGWVYTDEIESVFDDGYVRYKSVLAGENLPAVVVREIYHADVPEVDAIFVTLIKSDDEIALAKEALEYTGATVVQISVSDALAMDNANVQLDTASTQTTDTQAQADAQAVEAQADAQAAQAQAQADALAAQQAADAADAAAQAQITAQPDSTAVSQNTYTVEANDNLCKIAQKVYGDMKAWRAIYKANPIIRDDYTIYKGQVLVIPAR